MNKRYRILKKISSGRFSTVYLAYDEIIGRDRVIKEFPAGKGSSPNDYNILRKLRHPGIPEICDAFEENGKRYLAMDRIEGSDCLQYLKENGTMDETFAARRVAEVLEVLDYMHSSKPFPHYHGDIKPENVIIGGDRAILVDFGSVEGESASSGFCAPERLAGFKKSSASDIYSTGQLLYYMITGKVKKIFDRRWSAGISGPIAGVIEKSTRKNPMERYAGAAMMATDIKRALDLLEAGMDGKTGINTLCFPGNPETACECAQAIASAGKKVLVIDLDMLRPAVDRLFGVKKPEFFLQDCFEADDGPLLTKISENLSVLPCRVDYEGYEKSPDGIALKLAGKVSGRFDFVVFSCCRFPYDGYLTDALLASDVVLFSVEKGILDIRSLNGYVSFLVKSRNLSGERMYFMGTGEPGCNIPAGVGSDVCARKWLGNVPAGKERYSTYMGGKGHVPGMGKRKARAYMRILKKAGVL